MNSLKNFIHSLRRYKSATLLNLFGLTVAFASFLIIMMQAGYELGYDHHYPDAGHICRIDVRNTQDPSDPYACIISRPLGETLAAASADIETAGNFTLTYSSDWEVRRVDRSEEAALKSVPATRITPSLLDIFGFEAVSGNFSGFTEPGAVILSESLACGLFGREDPVGKILGATGQPPLKVIAVYRDFPRNSTLKNGIYADLGDRQLNDFNQHGSIYYIRIREGADRDKIEQALLPVAWNFMNKYEDDATRTSRVSLVPMKDVYFAPGGFIFGEQGNRGTTYMLLSAAWLIILIAAINYVNLAVAQIPLRVRSINTRKVFGCSVRKLRYGLIAEAAGLALISFLFALIVVHALSSTRISGWFTGGISLPDSIPLLWFALGAALLTGLVAGIFPAFYATSFPPALALKGTFGVSVSGKRLRRLSVAFQFSVSLLLLVLSLFVHAQNRFVRNFDIGINYGDVVTVQLRGGMAGQAGPFAERLRKNPDIVDIASAAGPVVTDGGMRWTRDYRGREICFEAFPVSPNLPAFMGLQTVSGRYFFGTDSLKPGGTILFNQTAQRQFGVAVSERIGGHRRAEKAEIAGIVRDFNFRPLQYPITPIALYVFDDKPWWPLDYMYIRVDGLHAGRAIGYIKQVYREMDSAGQTPDVSYMDRDIGNLYEKEQKLAGTVTLFSLVSVFISMVGVLGVVHFEIRHRRKEVALRKVYGSTTGEILRMFNGEYIRIIAACFIIVAPVAYFLVEGWLDGFAYKIAIGIWEFLLALAIVTAVTVALITFRCWRTAVENPIESIKTE